MVALGGVLGLGAGTIDAGLNTYAAMKHGSRVLNWMHAAFGLGAAIGPLVMTAILTLGGSWNVGYLGVGVAQLCLALAFGLLRQRFAITSAEKGAVAVRASMRALLREGVAWLSIGLFAVYVGLEVATGQWSFSLFTESRGVSPATAGVWVSAYWASMTIGRLLFGVVVNHVSIDALLRTCMLITILACGLVWLNLVPFAALAIIGLMLAPIFPSLIGTTPERFDRAHTADAIGLQVAAAVLGGAVLPGTVGVLAARLGLEVVGPCLVGLACALFVLHEALIRISRACVPQRSARSRNDAVASSQPGA
jgi:fucose permease